MTSSEYRRFTEKALVGRRARTTIPIVRGDGLTIPKGRVVIITRKFGGLTIQSRRLGLSISRVRPQGIELL